MKLTDMSNFINNVIPEQFTVKAHPALFEGKGEEGVNQKMRHCYSSLQLTIIHFQNAQHYSSLQLTYTFKTRTKPKNC